ncbi:MAG: hypothetical protein AB7E52_02890 [Bdellovibrionales bacterium]
MFRLLTLFLICVALCPSGEALAKEKPAKESLARPVYEPDGSFGFCLSDLSYKDGRKLTIAFSPKKQINIGTTIPNGKFQVGSRYDLLLRLNAGTERKIRAATLDDETLLFQIGNNASFRKKLERSTKLEVASDANTVVFPFSDMKERLKALEACNKTHVNSVNQQAAKTEQKMPETLKALLITAGLTDIAPLSMEDIPADQRPADYLWDTNGILSGVRERKVPADKSLDDMIGLHTQGLKKHCPGIYNAQIGRKKESKAMSIRTAEISCTPKDTSLSDKAVSVALLFYMTPNHVFTVFSFESPVDQKKEAMRYRDKLASTLTTLSKASGK